MATSGTHDTSVLSFISKTSWSVYCLLYFLSVVEGGFEGVAEASQGYLWIQRGDGQVLLIKTLYCCTDCCVDIVLKSVVLSSFYSSSHVHFLIGPRWNQQIQSK